MHVGVIWFVAAAALAAAEMLSGEFFLLMFAGGTLCAGGAALAGAAVWGQALAFAIVSVVLIGVARPLARRRLLASLPEHESGVAALPGRQGTVLETVTDTAGLVDVAGDAWTARPVLAGEEIVAGETVWVSSVEGAQLRVHRDH